MRHHARRLSPGDKGRLQSIANEFAIDALTHLPAKNSLVRLRTTLRMGRLCVVAAAGYRQGFTPCRHTITMQNAIA